MKADKSARPTNRHALRTVLVFLGCLALPAVCVGQNDAGKPALDPPAPDREAGNEAQPAPKLTIPALSDMQIGNLAMLGKVWGFLKYHHPLVTAGRRSWDSDLFQVLPEILKAADESSAQSVLVRWIDGLGPIEPCNPCASSGMEEVHLQPRLGWISQTDRLGAALSERLQAIYRNRTPGQQFYVSLRPAGAVSFDREARHETFRAPDAGLQILSLYRFWNVVEYWFPYRDLIEDDWDRMLKDFLPRIALAKDGEQYQLELMALVARVGDGHANLWSAMRLRPPRGSCHVPVIVRFVEGQPLVTGYRAVDAAAGLQVGDVIAEIDGVPFSGLLKQWAPYYGASNEAARLRDIGRAFTRGPCGPTTLRVLDADGAREVTTTRLPITDEAMRAGTGHELSGGTFRLLTSDVAYLKLSSIKAADAPGYIARAAGTRALIVDLRSYPSEFVVFALGSLLIDEPTPFVRFTLPDLGNPGAFRWTQPVSLKPAEPSYRGRVVVLVDETTQSQAEYTAMALLASPRAVVIGSATAGADGNMSMLGLPGRMRTSISGLGVFYPDKRPTQRIGIVPDVEVQPTIEGIRSGRDEVLDRALREIVRQ